MKGYKKTVAAALLLMVVLMAGTVYAQNPVEKKFSKTVLTNLITGIESENAGLKKSAIFMAGKYRVNEAVESLTELLADEKDPAVRLLIARALYEIGDFDGMKAVYELSRNDRDMKVRTMSKALYNDYAPVYENEFTILK